MSQSGRKKPDKWKKMLQKAEQEAAEKAATVDDLLAVQEALIRKAKVLHQIVNSFTALNHIAAEYSTATPEHWQQFEQQLQGCLSHMGGSPQCAAIKPHALDYFRVLADPTWAATVCRMSDAEVLQRVRQAMGRCALMVLQDQHTAAWQDQQHPPEPCTTTDLQQQQQHDWQEPHRESGGQSGQHAGQHQTSACTARHINVPNPAAAAAGGVCAPIGTHSGSDPVRCTTAAHVSGSAGNSSSVSTISAGGWGRGPAFEVSAIWGVLFDTDESRFLRLISKNLETGQELKLQHGPGFGKWLAGKLKLTAEQMSVLKGLRELVQQPHELLPARIQQVCAQQQQLTQHQQQQLHWTSDVRTAGQVYDAHEQALQQQAAALQRFRMLAKFMGLVTLNTLSPGQLAVLQACSWPALGRIEPVLDVLDDVEPHQG